MLTQLSTGNWPKSGLRQLRAVGSEYQGPTLGEALGNRASGSLDVGPEA